MIGRRLLAECRVRVAAMADLEGLLQLETESFESDRLTRRSYRALLERPSATVLLVEDSDGLTGALVLLFKRGSSIARLYSLAVARQARRRAFDRDCAVLRLEGRVDNASARELYESEGFIEIGRVPHYYADGTDAVRLERSLRDEAAPTPAASRYYA